MKRELALDLIDFLDKSPTAYQSVTTIKEILDKEGFVEVKEEDKWGLQKEGKYYVIKNDSALIAFRVGKGDISEDGFKLIGAHTDSPGFRIKGNPEIVSEGKYLKLNTEVYGGPLLYTWFDRPLGIAGRVTVKGKSLLRPEIKLLNIKKPLLIIPSVAIHMNREVNEGFGVNKQKDTLPLISLISDKFEKDNYLLKIIAKELNVSEKDVLGFDLALCDIEKGSLIGLNEEFISAGRLDDMWMVYAGIKALVDGKVTNGTNIMVCVDNEETGSNTAQGADSDLLLNILERITLALGKDREGLHRALANSIMISADLAHAVHPNAEEKHDPTNRPLLGNGPVLKTACSGSYSTDSYNAAIFEGLCKASEIPYQNFYNRSDVRGGSTIGSMTSARLTIPVMDMGAPLLSMHSIRELGTVIDNYYTIKLFTEFYNN
jgi:aspartyl aminopeptidase